MDKFYSKERTVKEHIVHKLIQTDYYFNCSLTIRKDMVETAIKWEMQIIKDKMPFEVDASKLPGFKYVGKKAFYSWRIK